MTTPFKLSLFFSILISFSDARALPNYEKLFSLKNKVLGLSTAQTLDIIELNNNALAVSKSIPFSDYIWAAAEGDSGIAIATGMKRGDLTAPTRVALFSNNLTTQRIIFEKSGERNQPTFIKEVSGAWWFGFFDSKYITKLGILDPKSKVFNEFFSTRVGDAIDVGKNLAFVGRAYGDELGQDGDLQLVKNKIASLLPSYRGIRSVKIIDPESDTPRVLIADGWHQNYAKFAQARLSLLTYDKDSGRYALQLLFRDPEQYGFSKIEKCGESILALGDKKLVKLPLLRDINPEVIASRTSDAEPLDFAVISSTPKVCSVLISNPGLSLRSF